MVVKTAQRSNVIQNSGAAILENGDISFCVWAPKAKSISLVVESNGQQKEYAMKRDAEGYAGIIISDFDPSLPIDYFYLIDKCKKRPDPASKWQPHGVHGPSRVYNTHNYQWQDSNWNGIDLEKYIIYELHIGTFTKQGTFEAAIEKLPILKELGITAIELMPIIEFPGERNWGYDGVYLYAPHHCYGGPEGLKRFVDACHQAGIAVILDVVYNHLGPEGNYLNDFGYYFTDKYHTLWGSAINFDNSDNGPSRRFFIENALYWIREFHMDALRLDAVHAIFDKSHTHILKELKEIFHRQTESLGRKCFLIAESDLNDPKIITSKEYEGYDIDAQWCDDFHHAIHTLLTGSTWHYFSDFGDLRQLAKAYKKGFVYDGQWSRFRKKDFGKSSEHIPGKKFVVCIQNHDQIGNAGKGFRLGSLVELEKFKLASTLLFFSPYIPLIFMGQEWNATSPFFFFTSFEDKDLCQSVKEGYLREFSLDPKIYANLDPQNEDRFESSKLKWNEMQESSHREIFEFYKALIALRKKHPSLSNCRKDLIQASFSEENNWLVVHRKDLRGDKTILVANVSDKPQTIHVLIPEGKWMLYLSSNKVEEFRDFELDSNKDVAIHIQPWTALILGNQH